MIYFQSKSIKKSPLKSNVGQIKILTLQTYPIIVVIAKKLFIKNPEMSKHDTNNVNIMQMFIFTLNWLVTKALDVIFHIDQIDLLSRCHFAEFFLFLRREKNKAKWTWIWESCQWCFIERKNIFMMMNWGFKMCMRLIINRQTTWNILWNKTWTYQCVYILR